MRSRVLPIVVLLFAVLLPAGSAALDGGPGGLTSLAALQGRDIVGPGEVRLGIVEDVLVGENGTTFLILSQGSAFGEIGPFRLIPWRLASPRIRKDAVVIAFGERIIERAPAMRMEKWPPRSLSPELIERVRAYYRQAGSAKPQ